MRFAAYISAFVLALPALPCIAQTDTAWFNKDWKTSSRKEAAFFRLPPEKMDSGYLVTDYFTNGNVQMQGISISAEKNIWKGWVQWFYENGALKQKGLYVYNRLDSLITFHRNGKVESTRPYQNNQMEGIVSLFDSSGNLQGTIPFKKGVREGVTKYYFPDGKVLQEQFFLNGKQNGTEKIFDQQGRLASTVMYRNDEREGFADTYFPSGKLKERITYTAGGQTGEQTIYYENGKLKERFFNEDYERSGPAEGFYANGAIRYKGNYAEGYLQDSWQYVDSLGNTMMEAGFVQGRLNGRFKIFTKGMPSVDAVFSKGRLMEWKGFAADGKLYRTAIGTDSLTEIWITRNAAGQRVLETQYLFNKAFGEWKLYGENEINMLVKTGHSSPKDERRYRQRALEEEWKKDELDTQEITPEMVEAATGQFSDIEELPDGLPEHYFKDELELLTREDFSNRFGYPEITRFYAKGAIRVETKVDFEYTPPVLVMDSSSIDGVGAILPDNIQYRPVSGADGLELIVQYEKLVPAVNEVMVFYEPPSEALQRVLRISIGSSLKKLLRDNTAQILQLNNELLSRYGSGFTPGEMAEQLCIAIFEKL
jgi:antitoxin component YwqK of YwqJK toxin-antitoxin module